MEVVAIGLGLVTFATLTAPLYGIERMSVPVGALMPVRAQTEGLA